MSKIRMIFVSIFAGLLLSMVVVNNTHFVTELDSEGSFTVDRSPAAIRPLAKPIVLVGLIPGEYFQQNKNSYILGYVEIANRVIQKMAPLAVNAVEPFLLEQQKSGKLAIKLLQPGSTNYDVIYPGLINLHNHTKQNVLPTWGSAKGQFQNRFEWRDWMVYDSSVKHNMHPWIDLGKPVECAAFRWSNLQNMINGGVYLQGPSSCITGFGILKVEDSGSYVSRKASVQAPTDLVLPNEMTYVWEVLGPKINSGKTYEQALAEDILAHCPSLTMINANTVNTAVGLKVLKNQAGLKAACTQGVLHEKFIRYVYWVHPTIAGKKEYLKSPNRSAVIAHLAEGRRLDPYNVLEYKLVKMLGLNQPYVNFIHGVGLSNEDFADMRKNNMGLVWSPYSNLLLYGETLDIASAHRAGVNLAIGSDWVPTGTKSVLEEIKLAARYVKRERIEKIFTDEVLYKMMTENSARMINHWEISAGEAGIGRLAPGAMGSVIVTTLMNANPYSNIVQHVTEKDVNLVVVDGAPIYGNTNYLEQAGIQQYEVFSSEIIDADRSLTGASLPKPLTVVAVDQVENETAESAPAAVQPGSVLGSTAVQFSPFLVQFSTASRQVRFNEKDNCQFKVPKAFVNPNTKKIEPTVEAFLRIAQLDLDKIKDLRQLLAASTMSHTVNRLIPTKNSSLYTLSYFPPLYSCNDPRHLGRITNYIKSDGNDELLQNLAQRAQNRAIKGMPKSAKSLAESYKQTYVEK